MDHALSEECDYQVVINATEGAAGTSDINGDTVDMAGYDAVKFVTVMGAITATAVTSQKVQQGAASDLSDAADLAGTGITIADDDDNQVVVSDIIRPLERYVRNVIDRGTANAVVASSVAIKYRAKTRPVQTADRHADVCAVEAHVAPAEGTA